MDMDMIPTTNMKLKPKYSCNSPSRFRFGSKNLEKRINNLRVTLVDVDVISTGFMVGDKVGK